jgi:hypothetical protein
MAISKQPLSTYMLPATVSKESLLSMKFHSS